MEEVMQLTMNLDEKLTYVQSSDVVVARVEVKDDESALMTLKYF